MTRNGLPSPTLRWAQGKLTSGPAEAGEPENKKPRFGGFYFLAPRDGLEPPTKWLTATRSTN